MVRKQEEEEEQKEPEDVRVLWIEVAGEKSIGGALGRVSCDKWTFGGAEMQADE